MNRVKLIKKYNIFLITLIVILLLGILLLSSIYSNNKEIISDDNYSKKLINRNALTMMYETEDGSGIYQENSSSIWPIDDYEFNANLSKCENGSSLTWDETTKKILMKGNKSDKCYIYFDKNDMFLIIDGLDKPSSAKVFLNGIDISNNINEQVKYKPGDLIKYTHKQACYSRGLKFLNKDNILIFDMDTGGMYEETYTLTGKERYIKEYIEGRCESISGGVELE